MSTFKVQDPPPRGHRGPNNRELFARDNPGRWVNVGTSASGAGSQWKKNPGFDGCTRTINGETFLFLKFTPTAKRV